MAPELEPFGYITPREDGTWEPASSGDGLFAMLLPVWSLNDELLDTVAWGFGEPFKWWRRHGHVTYLGLHEIDRHKSFPEKPLRLVANPSEWLRDGGLAVCILDWSAPLLPLMDELGEVVCEDPEVEKRLREKLAEESRPRVQIRGVA